MVLVFLFFLGLIIGSFLNVLGLRFNSGTSIGGRSFCVVCRKALPWWELIPVVSFVGLRGKCSRCKTSISWQYPLVELWTGFVFASLYTALLPVSSLSWIVYIITTVIFCIYIVITIYDVRHTIIPDSLVYPTVLLGIVIRLLSMSGIGDWLAGAALFSFFGLIWLLSKGRAMGFGDAKLGLSMGLLLGLSVGISAVVLAFWIGSGVSLLLILKGRLQKGSSPLTLKSEVPFAPFLIVGAWIALIFHLDLFNVLSF